MTIVLRGRRSAAVLRHPAPEPGTQVPTVVPVILQEQTAVAPCVIVETGLRNETASKSPTGSKIGQGVEIRTATTTGTAEVIATETGIGKGRKNGTRKEIVKRIKTVKDDTDVKESLLVGRNGIVMVIPCHPRPEEDVGRRTESKTNHPAFALTKFLISVAAKMSRTGVHPNECERTSEIFPVLPLGKPPERSTVGRSEIRRDRGPQTDVIDIVEMKNVAQRKQMEEKGIVTRNLARSPHVIENVVERGIATPEMGTGGKTGSKRNGSDGRQVAM